MFLLSAETEKNKVILFLHYENCYILKKNAYYNNGKKIKINRRVGGKRNYFQKAMKKELFEMSAEKGAISGHFFFSKFKLATIEPVILCLICYFN